VSEYLAIAQVVERYPIGRSKLYELMAAGHVSSFKLGRRRVVVASSIDGYLAGLANDVGSASSDPERGQ
jgi:predicted DNA-binding transcriptional regulator AlpA